MLCKGKGSETIFGDIALYSSHECLYAALVETDKEALKIVWVTELKFATAVEEPPLVVCPGVAPDDEPPEIGNETTYLQ